MYQVIARTWRPQRFSEVIGQSHVTETLQNAIRRNRIGHGYIFSGQRGVGKTTLARLLAKSLNCQQGPAPEPCGECDSCREVAAGRSVDVLEIDAASNRGIDAVRELRENARYAPARDRYKVFIIDEAHQITPEGFNALLKTLEEPPPHVVFILATTEAHQFPETILSRCQHFAFRAVSFPDIYAHLEKVCTAENVAADPQALAALTAAGEGSLRDALSRLEQAITALGPSGPGSQTASRLEGAAVRRLLGAAPSRMLEEVFETVLSQNRPQMLDIIGRLVAEGYQLPHFCAQLVRTARNLLVVRVAGPHPHLLEATPEEIARLAEIAGRFTEERLMRLLGILLELHQELRVSMEPRFQMELGLLKLVDAERLVAIEEVLARMESHGSAEPLPRKSSGISGQESVSPNPSPISSKSSSANRPSPFELDLARKRQAASAPAKGAQDSTQDDAKNPQDAASRDGAEVSSAAAVSPAAVSPASVSPASVSEVLPSREVAWVREVLRRLEEDSKPVLAALLADAQQWEFGESEVRIRLADHGIARVLPEADRRFLDRLVSDVLARTVRVQFAEDRKAAPAPATGRSLDDAPNASLEGRVRGDPEVLEFESLFGKQVTEIRRRRD